MTDPCLVMLKVFDFFFGFANYHRSLISHFSRIAAPLYAVTGKSGFQKETEQQSAFGGLKALITEPPLLIIPNIHGHFVLDTDTSDYAVGGELSHIQNRKQRTIGYISAVLSSDKRRYCTTRKALLAVISSHSSSAIPYLAGRDFTVRTDHHSLVWLMNF